MTSLAALRFVLVVAVGVVLVAVWLLVYSSDANAALSASLVIGVAGGATLGLFRYLRIWDLRPTCTLALSSEVVHRSRDEIVVKLVGTVSNPSRVTANVDAQQMLVVGGLTRNVEQPGDKPVKDSHLLIRPNPDTSADGVTDFTKPEEAGTYAAFDPFRNFVSGWHLRPGESHIVEGWALLRGIDPAGAVIVETLYHVNLATPRWFERLLTGDPPGTSFRTFSVCIAEPIEG